MGDCKQSQVDLADHHHHPQGHPSRSVTLEPAATVAQRPDGLELLSDIARQAQTKPPKHLVDDKARAPKESAEVRLQRFLEENGANNDVLIQCGATQQILKLSPRQMYEVLTSTGHASKCQQMFSMAQTPAQCSASGVYNASNRSEQVRPRAQQTPSSRMAEFMSHGQHPMPMWHNQPSDVMPRPNGGRGSMHAESFGGGYQAPPADPLREQNVARGQRPNPAAPAAYGANANWSGHQ